jgi:hypothetical protein
VTGLLGYGAARLHFDAALRQIEGENARLNAQHREDHLRNRQGTYHDALNAEFQLQATMSAFSLGLRPPTNMHVEFEKLMNVINGVELFGSEEAAKAARKLLHAYSAATEEARATDPTNPHSQRALAQALANHRARLTAARLEMLEAMRADVAPS